ncbi:hypothetical protein ACWEWG_28380 [Streptomyces sp. NPDC003758]
MLQTLRRLDEIRDPGDLAHLVPTVALSDRERRLAEVLVQKMIGVDGSVEVCQGFVPLLVGGVGL